MRNTERLYDRVIEKMDMTCDMEDEELQELIHEVLEEASKEEFIPLQEKIRISKELFNAFRKLDILQELIEDDEITEIMINGTDHIFLEKAGRIFESDRRFVSVAKLEDVIQQIAACANRYVNEASPIVDARLEDGSRVNVVLRPVALNGPIMTIRKFPKEAVTMKQLIDWGSISQEAVNFLKILVESKYNIFVSGGESADIILLEKDLMVLEDGVLEGRKTFGNINKYIKMTASSNFGNMFSVMFASAFLPFLPMMPIHLLIQNLLYDISQTTIPFDRMDPEFLKKPRKWDASDLSRFMIYVGPISSIFDIITYLVMWYVFSCNSPEHQTLFQTGWFVEGLLSQTLIVHMIRTRKIPFIQSRATWPVMGLTFLIMAIGILIPFTAFGRSIGLTALPLSYFPWLVGILLSYCILTQIVKNWYIRKFVRWL